MRFNIVKAKTALLVAGKNQCEIAESLELSRRWVGAAFNGRNISERLHGILLPRWACRWTN